MRSILRQVLKEENVPTEVINKVNLNLGVRHKRDFIHALGNDRELNTKLQIIQVEEFPHQDSMV